MWFGSQLQIIPYAETVTRMDSWLAKKFQALAKSKDYYFKQGLALLAHLLWAIWKARNDFIFNSKSLNPSFIIYKAVMLANESLSIETKACITCINQPSPLVSGNWRPSPLSRLKCNVDVAFIKERNLGVVVAIIKDCKGIFITTKAH